jgi:hypothetical protein
MRDEQEIRKNYIRDTYKNHTKVESESAAEG